MTGNPFDKLSHIAALRPRITEMVKPTEAAAKEERHARLARLLGADLSTTPLGRHLRTIHRFPSPAACTLGPRALRLLAPQCATEVADTSRWLFLDTETTGLAGGTGTYAFLVGVGWWEADSFVVEQFFMREHNEEASLLRELSQRLAERRVLVTFNGKSFDWPLLETRYRMTRAAITEKPLAHLDLLHPARQLWRFRLKSIALSELEREVLKVERGPDIPSHTIPARYFDFLRGGPEGPIVEVFRHNQMDLCGLAALAVRITGLMEAPEDSGGDAGEVYGVSRMLHRRGEGLLAAQGYQRALSYGLPEGADRIARRELALLARRQGDFPRANALWQELLGESQDGLQAYEQLAVHFEHRARNPQQALALAREALVRLHSAQLAGRLDPRLYRKWHDAFRHRLTRLQSMIARHPANLEDPGDPEMTP
jgi:uncharacterized protein YprB with RNaseH-like and TPR domain